MRIIKQFKESETGLDILKRMKPGDVVKIETLVYIKTDRNSLVSEFGTLWRLENEVSAWNKVDIKCVVRRNLDYLDKAIQAAERGCI